MGYNCFGGLGLVEKAVYFLKQLKIQEAKHSFLDACITHCPKPVRFNYNAQQKVLPFLFNFWPCGVT